MKSKTNRMYQKHWERYHRAVCSVNFYGKSSSRILGVTGFRVGDKIVTDDQIYNLTDPSEVRIRFYGDDGYHVSREISFSLEEFRELIPEKSEFENLGLAYFTLEPKYLEGSTSFELCPNCHTPIGKEVFTISYQYDQDSLALKSALISSHYVSERKLSYIQFDGTVRPGTSGSPLVEYESGKVIGIVANKELQIVKSYREILKTIDKNLEILETVKDKWYIDEVDPIQVLIANQYQVKHLSKEIFANFAIKAGYALDVNHLREHLENFAEMDFDHDNEREND